MSAKLEPPRHPHGRRLLIPHIDHRAKTEPDSAWVAIPVDDNDLTKGYKNISYRQFANGVNHTVKWLKDNLPVSIFAQPFQAFAYVGSKDLRYPFLAVAAGKLELVLVLPSSSVTPEGRQRILSQKQCTTFLHSKELAYAVNEVVSLDPAVKALEFPELTDFLKAEPAEPVPYTKTWAEGKNDPWLCFHTSGTTGYPKVIVHTQHMFAQPDIAAGLTDSGEAMFSHFAGLRWFLPMPMLHYVGMLLTLSAATFLGTVPVLLPANATPSFSVVKQILLNTHVDGALLVPALIDALMAEPDAFELLKSLKAVHYAGAPLSVTAGRVLAPHVQIVPAIGSTEAGAYYTEIVNIKGSEDWDYVRFKPHSGLVLEPRVDGMHELVFVRNPECWMQPVFDLHPEWDRFETQDLWVEHPVHKGTWKIVGRMDDYVFLRSGDGLYVSPLERMLEEHPCVRSAVIGGQGRPVPVAVVEVDADVEAKVGTEERRREVVRSLRPYFDRINEGCHEMVRLDPEVVVFAGGHRPFPRTVKDTVLRLAALKMYEGDIEGVYERCGYGAGPK
ncbi:hypothetical protein LTR70_000656 [Exophiala xenobiotica]|uniref:AMP-dependent synthetase/ligase domain-containing protein n=1 Tax=Lithohypha guttulata TaxID=1690604 RepID=A0ABR0KIW5_9EURO|nr:hypothetical protein LTR24_002097 [Lithohypha guttulata]KAK5329507.1 hypothetical protein LTR70_000656 [Exophiala xenobiotica]